MAEKEKTYQMVKFGPEVFRKAYGVFREGLPSLRKLRMRTSWTVHSGSERWTLDTEEEFYSEYRGGVDSAFVHYHHGDWWFDVSYFKTSTEVKVVLPSRDDIERVFEVLDSNYEKYKIAEETAKEAIRQHVKVFIGHGRSDQWRDLKDHLQDRQGFKVIAYETSARAGRTIPDILEEMSREASIAFLVYTGEDMDKDGMAHARENVIHETGLFQGKLGWKRSIVLLEEGCSEFSNIVGVEQLRFSKGTIREIFGDVVAIIFREFEGRE